MALDVAQHEFAALPELRVHPTPGKRVRALVGDRVVVDTTRVILVWEPRRIVPSYAVPVDDLDGELVPAAQTEAIEHAVSVGDSPPLIDPRTAFAHHTTAGSAFDVVVPGAVLHGAAYAPDDPDLAGHVVLDFDAFETWLEEEQRMLAHVRDPFKTVDTRRSSRRVVIEVDGVTLADSRASVMLFETFLPTRFYLPRDDVRMELLVPSRTRTMCAYKGIASYVSTAPGVLDEQMADIAWTYEEPENYARAVQGMLCFYNERVEIAVDGVSQERPRTPWS